MKYLVFLITTIFCLISLFDQGFSQSDIGKSSGSISIERSKEVTARKISFPKDHCFHQNNNEWIYFSGIVETAEKKIFGIMFTIFQYPSINEGFSYPSMLGICDPEKSKFHSTRIYGQNGRADSTKDGLPSIVVGNSAFIWKKPDNLYLSSSANTADMTDMFVEMNIKPTKDILLHGEDGFIPMGDNIPSGYYSLTNLMPVNGTISIGDRQYTIIGGRIWMDHQWGDWTWAGYAWDWFSLRFDDGGALMLFQFRDYNDVATIGNWTYRDKDGHVHYGTDFKVDAKRMFRVFPIDWMVTLPSIDAEFEVKPVFDNQTFTGLWEGLCDVNGRVGESQLKGQAFVELTGY